MKKFVSIGLLALALSGCGGNDWVDCGRLTDHLYDSYCGQQDQDGNQVAKEEMEEMCNNFQASTESDSQACIDATKNWLNCWGEIPYGVCSYCDYERDMFLAYCN